MGVMGLLPLWCGCKWVRWMGVESFEGRWSCFLRAVPVSHVMRRSVAITAAARGCFFLVLVLVLVLVFLRHGDVEVVVGVLVLLLVVI